MKKELLELVTELIKHNQRELDYWKSENDQRQIEYYSGKLDAYRIIEDYAN